MTRAPVPGMWMNIGSGNKFSCLLWCEKRLTVKFK